MNALMLFRGLHFRHRRPWLPIEDHRRSEVADPRLHGVQLIIEVEEDHRRLAKRQRVRLCVQRDTLGLVLLASRGGDQAVELRVLEPGDIAADSLVGAVEQWIQEVLGVGVIGVQSFTKRSVCPLRAASRAAALSRWMIFTRMPDNWK